MISKKAFGRYLTLYGSAIENWPEHIRAEALQLQHLPTFAEQLIDAQYLDEVLWNSDTFTPAHGDLNERIIRAARIRGAAPRLTFADWLQDFLSVLLPKAAFSIAATLALGLLIGLSLPASPSTDNDSSTYEDAAL